MRPSALMTGQLECVFGGAGAECDQMFTRLVVLV